MRIHELQGSLLDKVSCQCMSDLQILNSSEKLRSFCIELSYYFCSKPLFRCRSFGLKFAHILHNRKKEHCILKHFSFMLHTCP